MIIYIYPILYPICNEGIVLYRAQSVVFILIFVHKKNLTRTTSPCVKSIILLEFQNDKLLNNMVSHPVVSIILVVCIGTGT